MKKQLFISLTFMIFAVSLYGQRTVKIDKDQSKINWTGKKPIREHHGYVKISEGELKTKNNEVVGGSFVIDMSSITNTDLENDASNKKLVTHLKSSDFFDVPEYPTAKFVITSVNRIDNGARKERKATHRIEGNLTMKGVTKKIGFDASINILNDKLVANTPPFEIDRTKWGVNYQSGSIFSGLVDELINDDITLSVELVSD